MPHAERWIVFHAALILLLGVEYLLLRRVRDTHRRAVYATVLWVAASLVLASLVWVRLGSGQAVQYLAGYAIEEALSIDNLFIFLLLFGIFRIPEERQPRVLFWGVLGAVLMRGAFIAAGLGLLQRFHWISYAFALLLLAAAVRLLFPEKHEAPPKTPRWITWLSKLSPISERQDAFFVRDTSAEAKKSLRRRYIMTVLFLALLAVELSDIVFALDSIPAVLSITREPFLAYTSNIMAVMGLRSLYILLAAMLVKLRFLHYGLAAVLAFAAVKMLLEEKMRIGPLVSLAVIAGLLGITTAASLFFARTATPAET